MGANGWLSDMPKKFCTDELVVSDFRIFFFRYIGDFDFKMISMVVFLYVIFDQIIIPHFI